MRPSASKLLLNSQLYISLILFSRLETIAQNSKLATFENRGEQDCITKYLHDKYPGDVHSWAIGLRSVIVKFDRIPNIYSVSENVSNTE